MILTDWGEFQAFVLIVGFIAAAFWLFTAVNLKQLWLKLPGQIISMFVAFLGFFALAVLGLSTSCNTRLKPVSSPNGSKVAQISRYDAGATGGGDSVAIHWDRGLRMQVVFASGWEAVEPEDLHWINDKKLEIFYLSEYKASLCRNAGNVEVVCTPSSSRLTH